MKQFDLIYYCDGYPEIGMGHVFRGISIVNAFIEKYPAAKLAIQGKYYNQSLDFIRNQLNTDIQIINTEVNYKSVISIIDTMFYPGEIRVNNDFFIEVKQKCKTLIFLWDAIEYNVPKEVDIIINHLPYTNISGNNKAKKYLGLKYAPIASMFYEKCAYKLNDGYLLSVLGSTNIPELIEPLLRNIEVLDIGLQKIVVVSPSFDRAILLKFKNKYKNIVFKQNVPQLFDLIKKASVIITTYGSSTFQSMAAKIPTFTIAFQDFQNEYGAKLEDAGFCINLGIFESINMDKFQLLFDDDFKLNMHNKLMNVFQKPGMDNILEIISSELQKQKYIV